MHSPGAVVGVGRTSCHLGLGLFVLGARKSWQHIAIDTDTTWFRRLSSSAKIQQVDFKEFWIGEEAMDQLTQYI